MFVLIPGAGGAAWYWHRVVTELEARGYEAVAVELPGADKSVGLPQYTDAVVDAIGDRDDVVLVAQSMGGFTAPMVCARVHVDLLVLVNAMIPLPGETPGQWWDNTGWSAARIAAAEAGGYSTEFDLPTYFLHDVPAEVAAAGAAHESPEADLAFSQPCGIEQWPEPTTRVLTAADDRFFPAEFQRRVARDRLGINADAMPGGHLVALSRPVDLVDRLIAYTR
ncbi:alpha/beta hydrolase [Streptomyces sp. NBC_01497]|uniref:alpha/beta hydrolase n=1 Tax=Streptomyces sp. NBC_01497 TaxID=2903885 RepID=UPI002E2FFF94|nr:alpha/beta hydrolase [Streptomyces sp. NBC_01497]